MSVFDSLLAEISHLRPVRHYGQVGTMQAATLLVHGLSKRARLGDRVQIEDAQGRIIGGEILALSRDGAEVLPEEATEGLAIGDRVEHVGRNTIAPDDSWIGRVIDPYGEPLDGRPLARGTLPRGLRAAPPAPARRKRLGGRLGTGLDAFNTLLPLVRGQRIGLFAGSGVGKTMLLGQLARGIEADVVVLALVGERGRELRDFVEDVLGPEGLARAVVVSATSDMSPLARRRSALTAMAVAEHFRDAGQHVLLLCDSVTRFAEAHREIALAAGEAPSLRGFPPSTAHQIMSLAERAGPGDPGQGDITAVFTVLVAGSDMDEPVADILRGVLDGHVVLERAIAERGRFPAVDLMRSVSRSLPAAASPGENALIAEARRLIGAWERAEMMVQAGLYAQGSDPLTDRAIRLFPKLDAFLAGQNARSNAESFARLKKALEG
ncbi:FliI/YscN family ATPase [Pararhodobacter aggregans]|uniref:Flagellum-specific ATP synthase FliI n=1 Tax=Pararhodobacter aggregans TaxID=404875 RepID=A0A2T7URQ5_9RHOB|nr:FliI/YscN family ATPase [Pararhodobacter aggregans]PTX00400.1 flagellum-specific ATP synthase [Pararhodobacter aggregans]PVE47377.1 flagellum-specific ATP synthase FliI [Pararhodobacter aggregans]